VALVVATAAPASKRHHRSDVTGASIAVMAETDLPRWDVTWLHPSLDDPAFAASLESAGASMTRLVALYDEHGVRGGEAHEPTPDELGAAEVVIATTNETLDELDTLTAEVYAYVTTDASDATAQAMLSRLERHEATTQQLAARLSAWVASLGAGALAKGGGPVAAEHAYTLERTELRSRHLMSEGEEGLRAELSLTGASAWSRLHSDLTAQLSAPLHRPGADETELVPVTVARALATDPDPAMRRAAYDAEMAAWPTVEVALAAALNAIKGESHTVNERRGWSDPLAPVLFRNAVTRDTLDAMTEAVIASLPDFGRYLRTKATLHGYQGGLAWWDLFAPLPTAPGTIGWDEGCDTVRRAFGTFSPQLRAMFDRAMNERWVDAGPRAGKRGGAFCMSVKDDRSLVLMNWSGSADSAQTLAHELGHAYHNTQLAPRTNLQRATPMALAETASIFCETITVEAGLAAAQGAERLALLDTDLQGAAQVVVDIHSRFLFETEVFARRRERTLSPAELCELMLDAQHHAYGDGLDESTRHPYMWAVKGHYYMTDYYNWPYTYGLLFGLGLYAEYERDPERFRLHYDDLLSSTGLATAAELAQRFGIDVTTGEFWTASLDVLRRRIDTFVELAAASSPIS
jgi:pepF/M3 family oligoendopeptidase